VVVISTFLEGFLFVDTLYIEKKILFFRFPLPVEITIFIEKYHLDIIGCA